MWRKFSVHSEATSRVHVKIWCSSNIHICHIGENCDTTVIPNSIVQTESAYSEDNTASTLEA